MSSDIIERAINDIRAGAEAMHRSTYRWLVVLAAIFVVFVVVSLSLPESLYGDRGYRLLPFSILFFLHAFYFTSLLRKPRFATLYINNESSNASIAKTVSKSGGSDKVRFVLIFSPIYFAVVTGFLTFFLFSTIRSQGVFPAMVLLFVTWAALLYAPLLLVSFLLRHQESTKTEYVVPVFYALYLSFTWVIVTLIGFFVPIENQVYNSGSSPIGWLTPPLPFLSFTFLLFVNFLLGHRVLSTTQLLAEEISAPHLQQRSITDGIGIFPRSVQAGQSYNAMINFNLSKYACGNAAVGAMERCQQLEVELQAAGVTVDGDKRVKLCRVSPLPDAIWNCYFPNIGHNIINVIMREINSPSNATVTSSDDTRRVLFVHKTDVRVSGLFAGSGQALLTLVISGFAAITGFISSFTNWRPLPIVYNLTGSIPKVDVFLPSILSVIQSVVNNVSTLLH